MELQQVNKFQRFTPYSEYRRAKRFQERHINGNLNFCFRAISKFLSTRIVVRSCLKTFLSLVESRRDLCWVFIFNHWTRMNPSHRHWTRTNHRRRHLKKTILPRHRRWKTRILLLPLTTMRIPHRLPTRMTIHRRLHCWRNSTAEQKSWSASGVDKVPLWTPGTNITVFFLMYYKNYLLWTSRKC